MGVMTPETLDMSAILLKSYEIGELINRSAETADYLYWKGRVDQDPAIKESMRILAKKKAVFEECQRFGHFHPDYHAALEEAQVAQKALDQFEAVTCFKEAEARLDDLLHTVSTILARSVSDTIKVPGNESDTGGGCGSGGSCGCSGGCG